MKQYLDLLQHVLRHGGYKEDRTGVGTLSRFGEKMEFDLSYAFPAVTTKKLFFRGVKEELLWMLRGETNVFPLQARGVHIWDEWADENGDLGPVYGAQWRDWDRPAPPPLSNSIDQIREIVMGLRDRPDSRRHILSAWNVADLDIMQLAPCHILAQFYVRDGAFLDCQLYQRSGDLFLGVPFNIASYALLTHMIAHVTGYEVGAFYHVLGDAHIYTNHLEQVKTQLGRDPLPRPSLWLNPEVKDIDQFDSDDIALEGYQHHPKIEAPVAV